MPVNKINVQKAQWWVIILLGKLLLAIGLWYLSQINNNLKGLNQAVNDLGKVVQHVSDKQEFMEQQINFHDKQIEKIQKKLEDAK